MVWAWRGVDVCRCLLTQQMLVRHLLCTGIMPHAGIPVISERNSIKAGMALVRQEERMVQVRVWC